MSTVANAVGIVSGEQQGIEWKVLLNPLGNGANGYARVPPGHAWFGKEYDDIPADAHGGLTYADPEGWIGFDTMHVWDFWSDEALAQIGGERSLYEWRAADDHSIPWSLERVVAETKALADQIAVAS